MEGCEFELTQKVPAPGGGPGLITTTYLSAKEFEAFAVLPARTLAKTRFSVPPFGIDVFDSPLEGLTLADIEFDSGEEQELFEPPPQCQDGMFSRSGGISGACSYHGGESRPLYGRLAG